MECFQKNLEQEGSPVILMECRILKLKKKKCFPMAQIQMTQIVEMIPSKQPETVNVGTGGTDADLHNRDCPRLIGQGKFDQRLIGRFSRLSRLIRPK